MSQWRDAAQIYIYIYIYIHTQVKFRMKSNGLEKRQIRK